MLKKILIIALLIIGLITIIFLQRINFFNSPKAINTTPPPSPKLEQIEGREKVKYPEDLVMVLVGDSMTERLGNSDEIRDYLNKDFPGKTVEVLNYGFGSTNILSVPDRLTKTTFHGRDFRPILDIDFDLIIIESFGHNPLSELPLDQGLQKQTETLDRIVTMIKNSNPNAKIVFLATLAPNSRNYAKNTVDLTPEKRVEWATERTAYIKNHINYANSHNIPLINVYQKSLNKDGDGDLKYIDEKDYIHPSPSGIYLISQEIADFIKNNNLMP